MRRTIWAPVSRRRSRLPYVIACILAVLTGGVIYLLNIDSQVALRHMEQDVTNEALSG